ncbi:ATP-binding cassette domain-containing protein [Bifidobacterium porcinum]|uniref:ATP-binding cassette domain-containing protein n=1 Tax=Bifidobacterium porcinum TaxID=212365 RepID=UPI0006940860|nr:ATP-binding cassette domain-containing protein [Bifidobacterium porcinum]
MGIFSGLFSRRDDTPRPDHVTFTLAQASYTYEDGNTGLHDTTLTLDTRRTAVIGLNGSGKTTLLKLLDGSLAPTSGSITICADEHTLHPGSRKDRKRVEQLIGCVRREEIPNSFYRSENIAKALDAHMQARHIADAERQARIGSLLAQLDLSVWRDRPADALDSEHRHLLAIAAALCLDPAVLVADEPTKGLDEIGTAHVARALFALDRQVVFATHDTDMITRPEYAIDRALLLDGGRIVFDGSPQDAVTAYTDLIRRLRDRA